MPKRYKSSEPVPEGYMRLPDYMRQHDLDHSLTYNRLINQQQGDYTRSKSGMLLVRVDLDPAPFKAPLQRGKRICPSPTRNNNPKPIHFSQILEHYPSHTEVEAAMAQLSSLALPPGTEIEILSTERSPKEQENWQALLRKISDMPGQVETTLTNQPQTQE